MTRRVGQQPVAIGALRWAVGALVIAALLGLSTRAGAQSCIGDCNGDGSTTASEWGTARDIALGVDPLSVCPASDADLDGAVRVADLTRIARLGLNGCAAPAAAAPRAGGTVTVQVGTANGIPGQSATFDVTLDTGGETVAGIQVDIAFDALARVAPTGQGRPTCSVNPAINKTGTAYAFQPPGCSGASCTAMRALVLSLSNIDPIPDGSVLFTCTVQIDAAATNGVYPLIASNAGSSDPNGNAQSCIGTDGAVVVGPGGSTPTPTQAAGSPGSLILERARLRADTSTRPGVDKGSLRVSGVVNTNVPFGNLLDDIQASGLSARVQTAAGVDVLLDWNAADCVVSPAPRGPRVRCSRVTGGVSRSLRLRPIVTPNLFDLKLEANGLGFAPPLTTAPVRLTLASASLSRGDDLGGCTVRGSRSQVEVCREAGVQPTATVTPSPPATVTATRTITRTATQTRTSTRTPSITPTPSITGTPTMGRTPTMTGTSTPVVVPSVPLGTRAFTIEPGILLADASFTGTGLFTSGLSGANAANSFSAGPLLLDGGLPDVDGVAALSLPQDAFVRVDVIDGSVVCLKLLAAGSSGSIDCDGGTAYGVESSQPPGDVGAAFTLQTGLGAGDVAGSATLIVQQQVQRLPIGPPVDCSTVTFTDPPQTWAYTTSTATATKGSLQLSVSGEPFDCNVWQTSGSGGRLAAPVPGSQPPIGDVANVFRLAEAAAPLGSPLCTLVPGTTATRLEIHAATLPLPLVYPFSGQVQFDFGTPTAAGQASSACNIVNIDPIYIPSVGAICLQPVFGCGASAIECNGTAAHGIDVRANAGAGTCASLYDCYNTCDGYCFGQGLSAVAAGCTGRCEFNDTACDADADCQPFGGSCYGADPVGLNGDVCQCICERDGVGSGARPGELECPLGVSLSVETAPPCDGADVLFSIGDRCAPFTTAPVTNLLANANFTSGDLPVDGVALHEGLPVPCADLVGGNGVSGLRMTSAADFFGTALGDLAVEIFAECQ
ncbi:MAG: hypothetical protein ABI629_06115 [bacterium]